MQLNKKLVAAIAIVAAASLSVIPMMDAVANEQKITEVNKVQYSAIMPVTVDMKPGETRSIPVEVKADSALTVDLFVSSEGKEFIARNNLEGEKFHDSISATLNKQRSSFDAAGQSDNIEIVVSVAEDAQPGVYPLTLAMKQKVVGGSNLVQQYLYVNVE